MNKIVFTNDNWKTKVESLFKGLKPEVKLIHTLKINEDQYSDKENAIRNIASSLYVDWKLEYDKENDIITIIGGKELSFKPQKGNK